MSVDEFEEDSHELVNEDGVKSLSAMANAQIRLESEIGFLEQQLAELKERYNRLSSVDIPAKFAELGVEALTLETGEKVTVKHGISASIPKQRLDEAIAWLRANGGASIVKNKITTAFGRGSDEAAKQLCQELNDRGFDVEQSLSVHPQTLSAFVRELMENGEDVPLDLLGAYEYAVTKIAKVSK